MSEEKKARTMELQDDDLEAVTGGACPKGYCAIESHRAETLMYYKVVNDPQNDCCSLFQVSSYYCERGPCYMCAHYNRGGYCTHPANTVVGEYQG
ncbi:MAG: hypothetical protein VB082_03735 [Christensenella sp.]|nr:hypothetical protein [Christensenella sp.]